jgi:tetratricopeptide (TPR) repeat protein
VRLAAALLIVAGAALSGWLWLRPSPQALYQRALRIVSSDPAAAETLFRKAVARAGGNFPDAQLQICRLAVRRRDRDEVRKICATLDWRGGRSDLILGLGRDAVAAGDWGLARQARIELGTRPRQEAAPALENLAEFYRRHRQPAEELACLVERVAVAPDDPRSWWQLALAHETRENPAAAAEVYRRAIEHTLPPQDDVEMRHRQIERLLDCGDVEAAREGLARLEARDESQVARMQVHRAHLHRLAGDFEAALADLEPVWPQIGEIPDAIKLKAILQLDAGQFDEARRGLQRVVDAHPFDEVAHFKLAEACRRLGLADDEQTHRARHRGILAKRLEIRRLAAQLERRPANRQDCLTLARLYRELQEHDRARYWEDVSGTLE